MVAFEEPEEDDQLADIIHVQSHIKTLTHREKNATLKVIAAIHWHALLLYLQKTPWFRKAARPADQRDLYYPHRSLNGTSHP